jgi:glycosyltransferase 2 family protein
MLPMKPWMRRWAWPGIKLLLAVAIVTAVAWQFWRDLHDERLPTLTAEPAWLIASALLYLAGMAFSARYWQRLLLIFGEKPALLPVLRAYYLSQLGKYLPGKAWALMMRGALIAGPDTRLGVAVIATFYEVLTMMASGALLAAVLLVVNPPNLVRSTLHPALLGFLLLVVCGVPLLPAVFNRIVGRLAGRFQNVESFRIPQLRFSHLLEGLATTSGVWILNGLSLWATVQGVLPEAPPLSWQAWSRFTAILALAYVGGFVVVVSPGGVGVREWVLDQFLAPELAGAESATVVIVILLRLVWTAAELVLAAALWLGVRRISA